jgi:hypothetical protein
MSQVRIQGTFRGSPQALSATVEDISVKSADAKRVEIDLLNPEEMGRSEGGMRPRGQLVIDGDGQKATAGVLNVDSDVYVIEGDDLAATLQEFSSFVTSEQLTVAQQLLATYITNPTAEQARVSCDFPAGTKATVFGEEYEFKNISCDPGDTSSAVIGLEDGDGPYSLTVTSEKLELKYHGALETGWQSREIVFKELSGETIQTVANLYDLLLNDPVKSALKGTAPYEMAVQLLTEGMSKAPREFPE